MTARSDGCASSRITTTETFSLLPTRPLLTPEKISQPSGEYDVAEDLRRLRHGPTHRRRTGLAGHQTYDDGWDGGDFWAPRGLSSRHRRRQPAGLRRILQPIQLLESGFFEEGAGLDMETFVSLTHGDFCRTDFRLLERGSLCRRSRQRRGNARSEHHRLVLPDRELGRRRPRNAGPGESGAQ